MKSKTIVLAISLLVIAATLGCGYGGSLVLPPTGGNYSNASLKGSYVYEVHGFDFNFNPYRQIGVFTADGNGNITDGSDDSSASASGAQVTGSYTVGKDGTGFITITTSVGTINWAITLSSTSQVQLIEADTSLNARGTAELQDSSVVATIPSGTYVFHIHQEISAPNLPNLVPAAEVGSLNISSGSATGAMDESVFGTALSATNITATFNAPAGLGRGTGTLVDSSTSFTTDFVYYIVDVNKFVMLVTNAGAVGSGSAELQSGNVGNGLSGNFAFGSRGDNSVSFAGVATVGQFSAASGTITGTLDSNVAQQNGTVVSSANISSCYTASLNGRVLVSDLSGSTCSSSPAQVFWMVSPVRAFFVNAGSNTVEDGTADQQTAQSFTLSTFAQQYSLAMDGIDFTPELFSRVGVLQFDGKGGLKVNEVVNASASGSGVNNPGILAGTYTVGSNGRVVSAIGGGSLNVVMYAVSSSQAYVLQTDSGITTSGQLLLQQ